MSFSRIPLCHLTGVGASDREVFRTSVPSGPWRSHQRRPRQLHPMRVGRLLRRGEDVSLIPPLTRSLAGRSGSDGRGSCGPEDVWLPPDGTVISTGAVFAGYAVIFTAAENRLVLLGDKEGFAASPATRSDHVAPCLSRKRRKRPCLGCFPLPPHLLTSPAPSR